MHYHCGKDLHSHLKVNFVSVMGDLLEDSGDVLFLDAVLEKDHVRNTLKELPETFRLKKICIFQIKKSVPLDIVDLVCWRDSHHVPPSS